MTKVLALIRLAVSILPAGILALWGWSYVRACALVALAPGAPISLRLATPGGDLTLRAAAYSFDLRSGMLHLEKPELLDPAGRVLAAARLLDVSGIRVLAMDATAISARARDVTGTVVRERDGAFAFQSYLSTKPSGAPTPVSVRIDEATIRYVDETGGNVWSRSVKLQNARFAGSGSTWDAAAWATVEGVGRFPVSVRRDANGLDLRSDVSHLESSDLARHFLVPLLPPAWRATTAASLRVDGPLDVLLPAHGSPSATLNGRIEATGVLVQGVRIDAVSFAGRASQDGLRGALRASAPGATARFDGAAGWSGGKLAASGVARATLDSLADLPARFRSQLPKALEARGLAFEGRIGQAAEGRLRIASAAYGDDRLANADAQTRFDGRQIWLRLASGELDGAGVSAEGTYDLDSHALAGSAHAPAVALDRVLDRFPRLRRSIPGQAEGEAAAYALVSGSLGAPKVDFRIEGRGSYRDPKLARPLVIERFGGEGRYAGGALIVDRLRAKTPEGSAEAFGKADFTADSLAFALDARGLDLSLASPDLSGLAALSGSVGGPLGAPRFIGRIEAYDVAFDHAELALATAHLDATPHRLFADGIDLLAGGTQVQGHLSLDLDTQAIGGELASTTGHLGDLLGDQFAGSVAFRTTSIGGTLDAPAIDALATGTELLAGDVEVSGASATARLRGKKLAVRAAKATIGGGAVSGEGDYDLDARTGSASATLSDLDLSQLLSELRGVKRTALAGKLSGTAAVRFDDKGMRTLASKGVMQDVVFNGASLGRGDWNVQGAGRRFAGSVQTSLGSKFLAVENGSFDLDGSRFSGDLVGSGIQLSELYAAAAPYFPDQEAETLARLGQLDGVLQAQSHVSGDPSHLDLTAASAVARGVAYGGEPLGELDLGGDRVNGLWTIRKARLADAGSSVSLTGTLAEAGDANLDAEISNFDLSKLSTTIPGFPQLFGAVSSSASVTGPTKNPRIRATLDAEGLRTASTPPGAKPQPAAALSLPDIEVADGVARATGTLSYEGFQGALKATVPFRFPFEVPAGVALSASLTLAPRDVAEFAPFLASLDPARSSGQIGGELDLGGVRDDLTLSGGLGLTNGVLAFRQADPNSPPGATRYVPLGTVLKGVAAKLGLSAAGATLDVDAASSAGGTMSGRFTARLDSLDALLRGAGPSEAGGLLESGLGGKLAFTGFGVHENSKLYATSMTVDGDVALGGDLRSPLFKGKLNVSNLQTTIPAFGGQGSGGGRLAVDPRFDVSARLTTPARVSTSLATIRLNGGANLTGSLGDPRATATLSVASGQLRLPGGKVSLEPGGTVNGSYALDATGMPEAHVLVNLVGDSHVTALRTSDSAERYEVHVFVTGDLLSPDQLGFTATSEPPDLSQDQILALLGRTDLISALGGGAGQDSQRLFTNAALSFALPSLFDPLTQRIAGGLGLDYLSVEYDALARTSILAGKNLGGGFSIQARRQVSEPVAGLPLSYDYRLVYRLPARFGLARKITFFFGKDETVQWKLGLEYDLRF